MSHAIICDFCSEVISPGQRFVEVWRVPFIMNSEREAVNLSTVVNDPSPVERIHLHSDNDHFGMTCERHYGS